MSPSTNKSSEDQYARGLRRLGLAQKMLQYRVRQSWVREWTGCSERRIRSIQRLAQNSSDVRKRRGPLPSRASGILSTSLLRSEASAIAGVAQRFGILPVGPIKSARKLLPGLVLGERLCWLYEVYHEWVPDATLTMERFLLLVLELVEQKTLILTQCDNCNGCWIIDKLETRHRQCWACTCAARSARFKTRVQAAPEWTSEPLQQSLF
jgi:hypothetical protein